MSPVPTLGVREPPKSEAVPPRRRRDAVVLELAARTFLAVSILVYGQFHGLLSSVPMSRVVQWCAVLAIVLNAPYYLIARTGRWRLGQAYVRLAGDLIIVTGGLYGAGGLQAAPYVGVYTPVVLSAGFTIAGRASMIAALAATAAYVAVALLPPPASFVAPPAGTGDLWATAIFNLMVLNVAAVLALMLAAAYRRSRREAVTATRELEHAHGRIVEAERLRAIGELSAGASHHLNNLLAVALGRIQIALRRIEEPDEVGRNLEIAERGLLDAGEVVRRMSMFSRSQGVSEWVPVDLNQIAREVLELTRPRWQSEAQIRGITIDAGLEGSPVPPVAGDPAALREALMNLVLNAIDALPDGGQVTLRTWTAGARVFCAVVDTGVGMSAEVRRRAREPFFTTKGLRSTGLGLSLAYGIVRRHGGDLEIDSAAGRGTTVTVSLAASGPMPAPEAHPAARSDAKRRILLIDDDAQVRAVVAEMLAIEGHAVVTASGGVEGLAALEGDERIDLVLTDLGMPGMTGWEVARAARSRRPTLPVGLITGWGEEQRAQFEGHGSGDVDFVVQKPVTRARLARAVASALASRGGIR
jgi:signal transduction histidine kinase/CheY-like chemotaxis protein